MILIHTSLASLKSKKKLIKLLKQEIKNISYTTIFNLNEGCCKLFPDFA